MHVFTFQPLATWCAERPAGHSRCACMQHSPCKNATVKKVQDSHKCLEDKHVSTPVAANCLQPAARSGPGENHQCHHHLPQQPLNQREAVSAENATASKTTQLHFGVRKCLVAIACVRGCARTTAAVAARVMFQQ